MRTIPTIYEENDRAGGKGLKHFPACFILSDEAPGFPLDNDYG